MRGRPVALNAYGDVAGSATDGYGHDISSQRLDELDFACLQFALKKHATGSIGIDLGCGLGTPSIAFALAGARMTLVDRAPLDGRFEELGRLIPTENLRFVRSDLTRLTDTALPAELDFAYSQRTLHYLHYTKALALISRLASHLRAGGRMFLSASGLDSELGDGYAGRERAVRDRFDSLSPEVAEKHAILEPVCLYSLRDLESLGSSAGLQVTDLWQSQFGNAKAIFSVK